jgi:hypothetical protein
VTGERDGVVRWLMDSDPAIRWQVMRDLVHETPDNYEAEREKVAQSGWGLTLLAQQSADGLWGNSLYNGKWTSTTYSLYLLKVLGLVPRHSQALAGCSPLIEGGLYEGREIRFSRGQAAADLGVTALVLSITSYFGWPIEEISAIAAYLGDRQLPVGSWLPNDSESASDYEFETTLLVVEALMQFERASGERAGPVSVARQRGWRFLLERNLGLESGGPIKGGWTSFSFPPYWFYDCLTALDCLRASGYERDPGAQKAVDLVNARCVQNGRWQRGAKHAGRTYFEMEPAGEPSRWNTLRALRVLEWWDDSTAASDVGGLLF